MFKWAINPNQSVYSLRQQDLPVDDSQKPNFAFVFEQSSEGEVHFDVEIAIKVLRQAGYHSHAVFLAEKHMHHEWYLKIQLEDIKVKRRKLTFSSLLEC